MPLPPTDLNLPERIDFSEEEESRKLIGSGYKQPRHRGAPVLKNGIVLLLIKGNTNHSMHYLTNTNKPRKAFLLPRRITKS